MAEPIPLDDNFEVAIFGISSVDGETLVPIEVDPATGAVIVEEAA